MAQPTFLCGTFDEALDLVAEARDYLVRVERAERRRAGLVGSLKISKVTMAMTSRLTEVMAWLMARRAAAEGEIGTGEYLLSETDVSLDQSFLDDEALPSGLRRLVDRSFELYVRIARLEAQMLARRSQGA